MTAYLHALQAVLEEPEHGHSNKSGPFVTAAARSPAVPCRPAPSASTFLGSPSCPHMLKTQGKIGDKIQRLMVNRRGLVYRRSPQGECKKP